MQIEFAPRFESNTESEPRPQPNVHYIVPIIGTGFFGMGMVLVFLSLSNYLVDTYLFYAASALAANAVLRSLFGAAL